MGWKWARSSLLRERLELAPCLASCDVVQKEVLGLLEAEEDQVVSEPASLPRFGFSFITVYVYDPFIDFEVVPERHPLLRIVEPFTLGATILQFPLPPSSASKAHECR